ncbi:MAG: leucine-rich repeat protein [Prolixibacteraceae bacterium]
MKPKIVLLFYFFISSFSSVLLAQPVNINTAKTIAEHHLAAIAQPTLKSTNINGSTFNFTSVKAAVADKDTLYYILNDTVNKGFVIVSADERAWPILGYSTEGSFDEKKQPEAFTAWMDNRKMEIEHIIKNNIQPKSATKTAWGNLMLKSSFVETKSVEPLIQTKWGQECNYNSMCPADATGSCGHVPTGCVATAMAQIMKFWNFPTKGKGSHAYLSAGYGVLIADFGSTTYQWSQMPNQVTSENEAIAKLMLHCGISVDMRYGPGSSGSYDPRDELVEYFNYSPEAENVDRRSYSESDWLNLLKTELDYGRPIWYQGSSSPCNGVVHAFVCDGYQNSDYFHFNWGWGGSYDGYFYLGNLNPGFNSFSELQAAVIKISPNSLPDGYNGILLSTKEVGIGIKGGTAKIKINSSKEWKALSDQSWLAITPDTGPTDINTITFNASANPTTSDRTANVIISAPGLASQTIIVTQYGNFEVSSGNLKTVLSSQLSAITNLTISGTIDARDFKTMRDEMPALTDIDLGNVMIVEYSGYDGTISEKYSYSANEIPRCALNPFDANLHNTRLKSIILPPSITSIDDYAFMGCKNLTIEEIPLSVTSIGDNVFSECNGSTALKISASITFIGDWAFQCFNGSINVDENNPNYSSISGILFNKNQTELLQCPVSINGNYTIPSSVTTIGRYAFDHCTGLTDIIIPSPVVSIKEGAFRNCTGLTSLKIPSTVTSIGLRPFSYCSGMLNIDDKNPNYSAIDGVFFNKSQTELISCPVWKSGTYTIPSTVTKVSDEAFYHCDNISTIIIPSEVKSIGTFSFNCVGLGSLYVYPVSPVDLSQASFTFNEFTTTICNLYVPYGTKSIYSTSNQWQNFAKIVEIKQSGLFLSDTSASIRKKGGAVVVNISSSEDWAALSDQAWLTINPVTGSYNANTITLTATANPTTSIRKATVTISATGLASQTIEVMQYGNVEVIAGKLKYILSNQLSTTTDLILTGTIDARDFRTMRDDMPALNEINLSDATIVAYIGTEGTVIRNYSVTYLANEIPRDAFFTRNPNDGKYSLISIILPQTVNSIGSFALGKCTGINSIEIPSSVTQIEDEAFYLFKGLINVETNNSNYSSLEGVLFNKNRTTLIKCPSLKTGSYVIPLSVKTIKAEAFALCDNLTSITIPSSVSSLEYSTFYLCSNLKLINIPSSVTSIGIAVFSSCNNLTTIEIPSSVISIGNGALGGCTGLNSLKAYSKLPIDLTYSSNVFSGVNIKTCTLYVPYGSKAAYSEANQWKDFIYIVEMENQQPLANAGINQIVKEGSLVVLDGTSSNDIEGKTLTYNWSSPNDIILNDSSVSMPTFTAPYVDTITSFTFSLVVNDGDLDSPADQVIITVTPNNAPIANAGTDQTVNENEQFILDGSASSDPDNDELSYLWTAPDGITLNSGTAPKPTFTAPKVTTDTNYTFTLLVNDGTADSPADQVVVTVLNVSNTGILQRNDSNKLQIYPNPTSGLLEISLNGVQEQNYTIEVYNGIGQLKLATEKVTKIDISSLSNGIYVIKVNTKTQSFQQKIIKK